MKDGTLLTPVVSYRQVSSRLRRLHAAWVAAGSPDAWRFWYQDQHERLAQRAEWYGLPLDRVIAAAAALSPQRRWSQNLGDVDRVLGGCDAASFPYLKQNYWRAVSALLGEGVGSGPKLNAFRANLTLDLDRVTIDSWMLQCVGWPEGKSFTGPQYALLESHIVRVARSLGIPPAEVQALTWCAARGSAV